MTYKAYPSFLVLGLYRQTQSKLLNKTSIFQKNCRFHSATIPMFTIICTESDDTLNKINTRSQQSREAIYIYKKFLFQQPKYKNQTHLQFPSHSDILHISSIAKQLHLIVTFFPNPRLPQSQHPYYSIPIQQNDLIKTYFLFSNLF